MLIPFPAGTSRSWVHPCLRCGACCASFRASFYWAEADDATAGGVPVALTEVLTPHLRVMRGTNQAQPRCVALDGRIGEAVRCSIHPQRASVCREFLPSFENGEPNSRCDSARARYQLPPLTPADWRDRDPDEPEPSGPAPRWPEVA